MDRPLLNDKNEYPRDEVLARHLGKTKRIWDEFTASLSSGLSLEWNYYNDGKAWLGKLAKKKKTVCWVSIWDKFFKLGFYFTEKNDGGIKDLAIGQELKKAYFARVSAGKLKPLVVEIKAKKALADAQILIDYKIRVMQ